MTGSAPVVTGSVLVAGPLAGRVGLVLVAAWLLLGGAPALATDTVADLVFGRRLLAGITAPVVIDYVHAKRVGDAASPERAPVHMEIRAIDASGKKDVYLDMFEGGAHRAFGPIEITDQNPLVLLFLQRDVAAMQSATGGSEAYFRSRIRRSFAQPLTADELIVEVGGRSLSARRMTLQPFVADPQIDRFPGYKDKEYEFVVTDGVPGGLYRIGTRTPAPGGGPAVEESMTFETARPVQ